MKNLQERHKETKLEAFLNMLDRKLNSSCIEQEQKMKIFLRQLCLRIVLKKINNTTICTVINSPENLV